MREENETQQQTFRGTEAANEKLRQDLEQAQERNAALQERVRGLTETAANDMERVNSAIDLEQRLHEIRKAMERQRTA